MRYITIVTTIALSNLVPTANQAVQAAKPVSPAQALTQYVAKPDANYGWKVRREGKLGLGTYTELILTSQSWRDTVWQHQLFIYRPANLVSNSDAMLLVGGGNWDKSLEDAPKKENAGIPREAHIIAMAAEMMGAPVAVLMQVPHQPMFDGMVEDEIISYTFQQYLDTGDDEWPLLLPMVKSAVRAMDAVQEYTKQHWQLEIENFLVTGASKRGWTTWLTAAADKRVAAIAPIVIDMLNMTKHMELQQLSYGTASEQIRDYTEKGLHERLTTDDGAALLAIVDPYSYRGQMRQPKLIILGTNDRYWPVDALNLYWEGLEGDKRILYVPNNGHGLRDYPRIVGSIVALYKSLNGGGPLPKLDWSFDESDDKTRLTIFTDTSPVAVTAWTAAAATRDFRDVTWKPRPAERNGADGCSFVIELPKPNSGFSAVFAEAQFPGQPMPIYLSTTMRVIATSPQ